MKKLLKNDFWIVTLLFFSWKALLLITSFLAVNYFALASRNFLGGGFSNYIKHPLILSWANFDGEHYLSIAQFGYQNLQHSFFPLFPILINILTKPFEANVLSFALVGIIISNSAF